MQSMLRIGEAARLHNISNRTLRYWEEMGILKSERAENGYRYFDVRNAGRIELIALLRKLKMPIADIERMFMTPGAGAAIDALKRHRENLEREAEAYGPLIDGMDALIRLVAKRQDMDLPLNALQNPDASIDPGCQAADPVQNAAPQIWPPERKTQMSNEKLNNVRIVKLPAMTVASYRAESEMPERDCSIVFNKFVLDNNLHKRDGYRFFGFNNPSPSEGNPVYGYEMWVTIPEGFALQAPMVKKQFGGGLYASVPAFMNEIGERWKLLYEWCKDGSGYVLDFSFQWLEECTMDFMDFISDDVPDSAKQLDLLEPIKRK